MVGVTVQEYRLYSWASDQHNVWLWEELVTSAENFVQAS